jgi:hypothetical protein
MSSVEALRARIMAAHAEVKRGAPGARERLLELQRQYRMGQFEVIRTPAGATLQLTETPPARRRGAKRAAKPKSKPRSTGSSERPSWMLGQDEPWRLRF